MVAVVANEVQSTSPCSELLHQVELWGQEGRSEATLLANMQRTVRTLDLNQAVGCAELAGRLATGSMIGAAAAIEEVANHPACVDELFTKGEAETRCVQKWYKIAIATLLGAGQKSAANATFTRAISLRAGDSPPFSQIAWPNLLQTPTLWLSGLRSAPTWNCTAWPFVKALEERAHEILDEVLAQGSFGAAYPYLSQNGTWQNLFLFQGGKWDKALCALMPLTCKLLVAELPTMPGVPFATPNNEEVVIFRSQQGASVGSHCGATNNMINLHFTLTGASTTTLTVGEETFQLRDRHGICFQDSYIHSVDHHGTAERISLVVRVMHPDMHAGSYGSAARTDAVDLRHWDAGSVWLREVDRLRSEYRQQLDTLRGDQVGV